MNQTALFVGAGNMGRAIIKGYLSAGGDARDISIVEPFIPDSTNQELAGAHVFPDFESLIQGRALIRLFLRPNRRFSTRSVKISQE